LTTYLKTDSREGEDADPYAGKLFQGYKALVSACIRKRWVTLVLLAGMLVAALPTSIDRMSPGNPVLLTLAEMPLAPRVKAHSIVPRKGDDRPPEGKDGVVAYRSAHLDYVQSELIVPSGHRCQQHPVTIEEVRRILLLHAKELARETDAK
jgi:hypothetical protein